MDDEQREAIAALKRAARGVFWATGKLEPKIPKPHRYDYVVEQTKCRRCDDGIISMLYVNGLPIAWKVEQEGRECRSLVTCGVEKPGGKSIGSQSMTRDQALELFCDVDLPATTDQ
jgi:hypothetical protein